MASATLDACSPLHDAAGDAREPILSEGVKSQCCSRKTCLTIAVRGSIAGLLLAGVVVVVILLLRKDGGIVCNIDECTQVFVPSGATNCSGAICGTCQKGYLPATDALGGYCGLVCGHENCMNPPTAPQARTVSSCTGTPRPCQECVAGYELARNRTTMELTGGCRFSCTQTQHNAGCADASCNPDGTCNQCVPGFVEVHGSNLRSTSGSTTVRCKKETQPVSMTFYMYRSQDAEDYAPSNDDLANAAGVMWYLHNEVVRICPRKFNIIRIIRYRVTVFNTQAAGHFFGPTQPSTMFGHYVQFDSGKCTVAGCEGLWPKYGYMVGCQPQAQSFNYSNSYWYSIPGSCPNSTWGKKTPGCEAEAPGGSCAAPNGTDTCTWSAVKDGEIMIDELSGIKNYTEFCAKGDVEYDPQTDKGRGCSFWDDKGSIFRNTERVHTMLQLFAKHYPTNDAYNMPDPVCDGW